MIYFGDWEGVRLKLDILGIGCVFHCGCHHIPICFWGLDLFTESTSSSLAPLPIVYLGSAWICLWVMMGWMTVSVLVRSEEFIEHIHRHTQPHKRNAADSSCTYVCHCMQTWTQLAQVNEQTDRLPHIGINSSKLYKEDHKLWFTCRNLTDNTAPSESEYNLQ